MCPSLVPSLVFFSVAFLPSEGRPVYSVRSYPEVTITGVNAKTKRINVQLASKGGGQILNVGPKTWIVKDDEEATFADLRVGQRLRVWYIPRGAQAVALEVLPPNPKQPK
jgi:hypothetical protein